MNRFSHTGPFKYYLIPVLLFNFLLPSTAQEGCGPAWVATPYARCYGQNGLEAVDLDGDGRLEIITMATGLWEVLRFDEPAGEYREVYVSEPVGDETLYHLTAGDIDADGRPEILVAGSAGLEVFSASDYSRLARFDLPQNYVNDLLLDDIDNDGDVELLLATREHLYVMDMGSGELTLTFPFGAQWVRMGQVDNDAPREIVTSNGKVIGLQGKTYEVEWDRRLPHDRRLAVGDIEGDGVEEILEATDGRIDVFNARSQSRETFYEIKGPVDVLEVLDLAGDARAEILCHRINSGQLKGLSTYTGEPIWLAPVRSDRLNALVVKDMNGDGKTEIITGEGCPADRPSFLRVLLADGSTAWQSREAGGPCRALEIRDVDGDGKKEVIALSSQASEEGVLLSVYDAQTKNLIWRSPPKTISPAYSDLQAMVIADIDGDDILEIIVGGGSSIGPRLWIFSGAGFQLKEVKQYPGSGRSAIQAMAAGDLDGDGRPEIVACTGEQNLLFSGPDLKLVRAFGTALFPASRVVIGSVDEDPAPEILIHRKYPYLFDGQTHELQWGGPGDAPPFAAIDLFDLNGDGRQEITGFTGTDSVKVLDGISGELLYAQKTALNSIINFRAEDLNGDGHPEWLFSNASQLIFYGQNGRRWQTARLGSEVGGHGAFALAEAAGRTELYLGYAFGLMSLEAACFSSCLSVELQLSVHPAGGPGIINGRAAVEVTGGRQPYQYEWSTGDATHRTRGVAPGTYTVTVTDAGGCTVPATVAVGIAPPGTPPFPEIDLPPSVSSPPGTGTPVIVFPNPAEGLVNLQWTEPPAEKVDLRLLDALGRQWARIVVAPGSRTTQLPLHSLPDGLYFLVGETAGKPYRLPVQKGSF